MTYRAITLLLVLVATVSASELDAARQLLLTGRYEEAIERFSQGSRSEVNVLGMVDCHVQQGDNAQAIQLLENFIAKAGKQPLASIYARAAELCFDAGAYDDARSHVAKSLVVDPNQPRAMFVKAELLRVSGNSDQAAIIYEKVSKLDADELSLQQAMFVGRSVAIHGRRARDVRVFDHLVNELYPRLVQREPKFWPAHLEIGKLFLEKYNEPEALRSINAALAINPRSAETHLALGRVSLEGFDFESAEKHLATATKWNPVPPGVLRALADLALHNQQFESALEHLGKAAQQNPLDERTLGRQLAIYLRLDGLSQELHGRAAELVRTVEGRNPQCGAFYSAAAGAFEAMRIYPPAGKYYQLAIERDSYLIVERGKLGLVQMRLGQEADARATLEEAFQIDPFNVRVKNTLEVLDLLDRYAVTETDHFILRFDRGQDGLLAEYAARYLEETVYPDIVKSLGYEPKEKTLLEIFSRADGTSGHGWFSARMVGLPFIGTVGACAGKMFALTSPADGKPYNWARVLRHEFVHVVNLQQTNFQIPHWFTEALAVRNEGVGYPTDWDTILAKYVTEDQLFELKDINHGFTRPGSSERWTLAYYQAYLYADYIVKLQGESALGKLIEQYAQGASTEKALLRVTGQSLDKFEQGYRAFLEARVQSFVGGVTPSLRSQKELERAAVENPDDEQTLAALARLHLRSGRLRESRRWAEKALVVKKTNSAANGVMAELMFSIGEDDRAWKFVTAGLAADKPESSLISLAANRKLDAKQYDRAEEYFQLGRKHYLKDSRWTRGLARVYLASGDSDRLISALRLLAEREPDKATMARKLTQLTLRERRFVEAEKWANRVIQVDVTNPLAHAELGQAYAGQGKTEKAIREFQTALKLSPGEPRWEAALEQLGRPP